MAVEDANNYGLTGAQVKELVEQTKKRAVSVGEDGSSHVEEADQIYTKTLQLQEAGFIFRTTAGDLSVETGSADLLAIKGHTVQEGHYEKSEEMTSNFSNPDTTATINWATFEGLAQSAGTVTIKVDEDDVGKVKRTSNVNGISTIVGYAESIYSGLGISISGTLNKGDIIAQIVYQPYVLGTLTTATPTSFIATGYNQYDATAGYAHVIGGQEYRVDGTYTSLGFTETEGGTTTVMTVTNDRFIPESDGYVYPSGVSGDLLIALVWTGTRDNDPYEVFSKTTITIPTIDKESNSLPTATYGMPSVHDVADELNFADKLYIQRIGHYAYSAENLETVEALGVDYWYDEEDIFYVLETPIKYKLADSVRGEYTANDFGTEEFVGTSVSVDAMLTYGNNLVDKLRNLLDIQSIGDKLELNGSELNVAQSALSDVMKVTPLSKSDYNWPQYGTKNKIAYWLLPTGFYELTEGNTNVAFNSGGGNGFPKGTQFLVIRFNINSSSAGGMMILFDPYNYSGTCRIFSVSNSSGSYSGQLSAMTNNTLTSYSVDIPLAASQGRVLAPQSASGAPTTTTQPDGNMVGKLYIDTDTQNVYIYVGKSGNDYIWKQINVS